MTMPPTKPSGSGQHPEQEEHADSQQFCLYVSMDVTVEGYGEGSAGAALLPRTSHTQGMDVCLTLFDLTRGTKSERAKV